MKKFGNIFKQNFVLPPLIKDHATFLLFVRHSVCKWLDKIGLQGTQSNTDKLVDKLKKEVTDHKITLSNKFDLEFENDFKTLPIMYWLPKMHKTPTGAIFIVASRK